MRQSTHTGSRWIGALTIALALVLAATLNAQAAPVPRALAETAATECTDFKDLAVGTQYNVGGSFTSGPHSYNLREYFFFGGGSTTGGVAEVDDDQMAGGTNHDLNLNNINLELVLPVPVAGVQLLAGEYGGDVNLSVNGDLRKVEDPDDLDGLIVGGAQVAVLTLVANEKYEIRVIGTINSFAIGGQEFWVDDICTVPEPGDDTSDPLKGRAPDLGDAPDSTNHAGVGMAAYPAVPANFPTVWEGPAANPSGPRHNNVTREGILGNLLSREAEADQGPDGDPSNNILPAANIPNRDRDDDGWRNRTVPMLECRPTTLIVRVTKPAVATLDKMYLNFWIDANRDGDWQDGRRCKDEATGKEWRAYEWIVQDYVVDMTTIPAGGFVDIPVTTYPVAGPINDANNRPPAWARLMLSEAPAVRPAAGGLADGRGPQHPNAYAHGETEDYLVRAINAQNPDGKPGDITLTKTPSTDAVVQPGEVFTFSLVLEHVGGDAPTGAIISDTIPAGLTLAGAPVVTEEAPTAGPLVAAVNGATIQWVGALSPGGKLRIDIPVRAVQCYDGAGGTRAITNIAVARMQGKTPINAQATVNVQCSRLTLSDFTVTASVEYADDSEAHGEIGGLPPLTAVVKGPQLKLVLEVTNNGEETGVLGFSLNFEEIKWLLPAAPEDVPLGRMEWIDIIATIAPGETTTTALLLPAVQAAREAGAVAAAEDDLFPELEEGLRINVIYSFADECGPRCRHQEPPNLVRKLAPLVVRWYTQDLGDAPDSTNHFGAAMTAYAGVPANYPTVFDPAVNPVQGPRHYHPRPFHLGKYVSWEGEADFGPDQDGLNNLRPPADVADRDRHDDGTQPPLWPLAHCRITKVPVQVYISPAAHNWFTQNQRKGVLNVWIDGNRDGDWADGTQCPQVENQPPFALEHVVIDYDVDVTTLGPGLHTLSVETGRVPWPAEAAEKPAWIRVTLSERESNKPLNTFGVQHGDGRGFAVPFRLGETEDYLWRPATATVGPDVVVNKRGRIVQELNSDTGKVEDRIVWTIAYRNDGDETAQDVVLRDRLDNDLNIIAILIGLLKPDSVGRSDEAPVLVFDVGDLPPGAGGRIVLITSVPTPTAELQQVTNVANAVVEGDVNSDNNVGRATVNIGVRPPRIVTPIDGTTCSNGLAVQGLAVPGATVDLYVDGTATASTTAGGDGRWAMTVILTDGTHVLKATATVGGVVSPFSNEVTIKVDSSLTWSPISLRFIDPLGRVRQPVDAGGRLDVDGWQLQLRPQTTYTVEVNICCDEGTAVVTLNGVISEEVSLTDPDNDGTYTGVFTTGPRNQEPGAVSLTVLCGNSEVTGQGDVVLIDPAGTVYDIQTGTPLEDANVACMEQQPGAASGTSAFALWDAATYGQVNPQSTPNDGYYSFFTPAGTYQVAVTRAGYQPHRSPNLEVIADPVYYDVPLTPVIDQPADVVIQITEFGFEPPLVEVKPGTVIEWVNSDVTDHSATRLLEGAAAALTDAIDEWDSGALSTGQSYKTVVNNTGIYAYRDRLDDTREGTILVVEAEDTKLYLPAVRK